MIRVGTAGWSYADWEGVVFPRPRGRRVHPLAYLAGFVEAVEINASFYATPRADHAERWAALVRKRPRFRFTAKLQNTFTHHRNEAAEREEVALRFREGLEPLRRAGRLGALLVQFPFSFRFGGESLGRLEEIAARFADFAPLVLEVRERSWFTPAAREALERLPFSLAAIDLPQHPRHPPGEVEPGGPVAYLRLHGRNAADWFRAGAGRDARYDYLYSAGELEELAATARRLARGVDETYVVTNNHFRGQALANALELRALFEGRAPVAPEGLRRAYPHLRATTRPEAGQGELFGI